MHHEPRATSSVWGFTHQFDNILESDSFFSGKEFDSFYLRTLRNEKDQKKHINGVDKFHKQEDKFETNK